jgi:hypothetical protein
MFGGEKYQVRKEDKLPREMQRGAYMVRWCNDNIAGCRSAATGLIPVRTATIATFRLVGYFTWNEGDGPIQSGPAIQFNSTMRQYANETMNAG